MRSSVLRLACALPFVILVVSARPAAAEPPPPSDAELSAYIAVQDALVADTARRAAICALISAEAPEESGAGDELAAAARRAEANPIFGPLLRRNGLSGRRYGELSVQVFGVLLGAVIADETDAAARAAGRPEKSRQELLASSSAAPPILARQQDLTRALSAVQAICGAGEDDSGDDDEEPADPGRR